MQSGFRIDLQALRGVAVLLVLLYHADLFLPGGYLGVDVFFVISGYLITGLVARALGRGEFSFAEFYYRRAKRLLPAAYVTFLVTGLLAPVVLNDAELRDFFAQLIGALTFSSNVVLFLQSGYFEGAADLKPLLHIWSLSIEEQYYFLLPAALVFLPQRFRLPAISLVVGLSALACFVLLDYKPIATFYLLPTRAWELGLGSILALMPRNSAGPGVWSRWLFWPATSALLLVPLFPLPGSHPGLNAALVCLATVIVIARRHPDAGQSALVRGLARVGDISYSLYLAHWPVFAFLKNASVSSVGLWERCLALVLSVVLGYCLYRFVERPIREMPLKGTRAQLAGVIAVSTALVVLPLLLSRAFVTEQDFAHIRRPNDGFSAVCISAGRFELKAECRSADKPAVMVWGDSYAMHLVPGVVDTSRGGVAQATMGNCGPVLDMAPTSDVFYTRHWAASCIAYNRQVFEHVRGAAEIEIVVLASSFRQYLMSHDGRRVWRLLTVDATGNAQESAVGEALFIEYFTATVEALRAAGKRVVVVGPTPSAGFNVGACLERRAKQKLVLGAPTDDCTVPHAQHLEANGAVIGFLDRLERAADVGVIRLDEHLCSAGSCRVTSGEAILYVDAGHLTHEGSVAIAREMRLGELIEQLAR